MTETPSLVVSHLVKMYANRVAVGNLSFSIEPGEIFGLLGPNGAGKTTTISMLTGLEPMTEGEVWILGKNLKKEPIAAKKNMGVVPQELISHGFFSAEQILHYHCGYYGIFNAKKRVNELIDQLNLEAYRSQPAMYLSGGLKRRLLLGKALVHRPKLLLLDEPTAGVDVEFRDILWGVIRQCAKEGTAVLLTTHYLQEAELLCGRIGIIYGGKLVKLASTQQFIEEFSEKKLTLRLKKSMSIQSPFLISLEGKTAVFRYPRSANLFDFIRQVQIDQEDIQDLTLEEGTLEQAFRQIIAIK